VALVSTLTVSIHFGAGLTEKSPPKASVGARKTSTAISFFK
jgi:hypothetical protein